MIEVISTGIGILVGYAIGYILSVWHKTSISKEIANKDWVMFQDDCLLYTIEDVTMGLVTLAKKLYEDGKIDKDTFSKIKIIEMWVKDRRKLFDDWKRELGWKV